MREEVNDRVEVLAAFGFGMEGRVRVAPYSLRWRGRQYRVTSMGMYHPASRGTKRVHVFSFAADGIAFRVEFDSNTLVWTLRETYTEGGV